MVKNICDEKWGMFFLFSFKINGLFIQVYEFKCVYKGSLMEKTRLKKGFRGEFEREKVGNLREKQRIWKGEEVKEKLAKEIIQLSAKQLGETPGAGSSAVEGAHVAGGASRCMSPHPI